MPSGSGPVAGSLTHGLAPSRHMGMADTKAQQGVSIPLQCILK